MDDIRMKQNRLEEVTQHVNKKLASLGELKQLYDIIFNKIQSRSVEFLSARVRGNPLYVNDSLERKELRQYLKLSFPKCQVNFKSHTIVFFYSTSHCEKTKDFFF